MSITYTKIVEQLSASVPFVGPEAQERAFGNVFKARIGANESVFGMSSKAMEAIQREIAQTWQYGDPENFELKNALSKKHNVSPSNIVVGEGIDGLLGYLVRLIIEEGDNVVTTDGAYPTFNYHVNGYGGQLHKVPFKNDTEDLDNLLSKVIETSAKILYVSNPNNPMGTINQPEAIEKLIQNLPKSTLLCLDEAYIDFLTPNLVPNISIKEPNVIRMRTFSKAYGMAGLRVGYAIGEQNLILNFEKIRNHFGMSRVSQAAALAALEDDEFIDKIIKKVELGKKRISKIVLDNNCKFINSYTNFISIDCLKNEVFAKNVLENLIKNKIFVRMPYSFPQNRCIRVTVGLDEDIDLFEKYFPIALKES